MTTFPTQRSFVFDGQPYHVVFFVTEGARLVPKAGDAGAEPVDVVECQILDESLSLLADGRALKSADDTFDDITGSLLSLSRALDSVYRLYRPWRRINSYLIIDELLMQAGLPAITDAPADILGDWSEADSHVDEAKIYLAWVNDQPAAAVDPDVIVWRQVRDGSEFMPDSYWVRDANGTHYMEAPEFQLRPSWFDTLDFNSGYERCADPRQSLSAPALSLNNTLRATADRLGIRLESSSGPLTMSDLSKLYHVLTDILVATGTEG